MANVGVDRDLRMLNTAVVVLSALTLPQATTSLTADPPAAVLLRDLKCAVPGESAPNLTLHVTANVGQEPRLSLASRSPVGRIWIFDDPHWTPHAAPRFENLYRSLAPLGLEVIVASVRPSSDVWEIAERTGSQLTYARSTKLAATDKQQVEWPYEMYPGGTEFPLKERLDGWVLGVDPQGKVAFAQQMSGNNYELIYDHVRSLLGIPNDPHVLLEQYLRELDSGGSQSIPALLWQLSSFSHAQFDSAKVKQVVAQFEPASIGKATDFVAEISRCMAFCARTTVF